MGYRKIDPNLTNNPTYLEPRIATLEAKQTDASRQTQTLIHGLNVLNSTQNSPVDFEIQGRTLVNVSQSNLLPSSYYVLPDKKTKIRAEGREGTIISGVAKFQKSASLVTKADFTGKVRFSVTENAHIVKFNTASSSLLVPSSGSWTEQGQSSINQIALLNGITVADSTVVGAGNTFYSQHLYSFNIIEQIERKMGRIPASDVAGKVAWVKANLDALTCNWHGFGSSVGGNGVSFTGWNANAAVYGSAVTHTNGTVTKLSKAYSSVNLGLQIDSNGFTHFLAYTTNPSDGTTPSTISTDFVECEITLLATAVLDTKPIITRIANFESKISASTVENPHVSKHAAASGLLIPSGSWLSETQSNYDKLKTLDGAFFNPTAITNGQTAQQLFSFDLIQEVERNIGRIPKSTTADKVQWLKDNVEKIQADWYGFGSSVGGNSAKLAIFNTNNSTYQGTVAHTNSTVTKLTTYTTNANLYTDSNGFVHFLCYAEPSDSVVASTINTDYIELFIVFKQGATLFEPVLPLYEIPVDEYNNVLVSWTETDVLNRYPKVVNGFGNHLQNLAVIAEGENLLPPFSEWTLHANAKVLSPYELELNATALDQNSSITISVIPNTTYTIKVDKATTDFRWESYAYLDGIVLSRSLGSIQSDGGTITFTTSATEKYVNVRATNRNVSTGKFTFTRPMLNLGSTAKPFTPRNPSYLFIQTKLGQIGTVKDTLFKQDGQWLKRKVIEKDVVMDGSLGWVNDTDYVGFKRVKYRGSGIKNDSGFATKFNGSLLVYGSTSNGSDRVALFNDDIFITVSDLDAGFPEAYVPTNDDWKRYFNGWKYSDGITWTSVTGNGQTATGANALSTKPTDYVPYKLSYVLATPQTLNISNLVEGDIAVSGATQITVDSGVIVREKVIPPLVSGYYFISDTGASNSNLKYKNEKIMKIFKNGIEDKKWSIVTTASGYGKQRASIIQADYDTTATYEVTYLVLDRHLFTNNAYDVKAFYESNLKGVVDTQVEKVADLATQSSINTAYIYRLLVAAKGAGWNV